MTIAPLQGRGSEVKRIEQKAETPRQNHAENERDGLIEVNETAGTAELVSGREQDADFSKQPEQAAQEAAQQLPHPSGGAAARAFPKAERRRSRACFGAYRRCPYPCSIQKGDKASAAGSVGKNKDFAPAIHRGRTGNAGASKGDPQIGKSCRPLGRSAGGYSEKESLDKRAHL